MMLFFAVANETILELKEGEVAVLSAGAHVHISRPPGAVGLVVMQERL